MKIILANLPWKSFGKTGVRAGSRWPHVKGPTEKDYLPFPFFLAYSAALLKKNNFNVELIDAIAQDRSYGSFFRYIKKVKPEVLVCETSTVSLLHDMKLLEKIDRSISLVVCGSDINIRQPSFLERFGFIDYVLVGEYEFTLLDLVSHLRKGESLDGVAGLIYRDKDKIRINPPRALVDLNKFPWPLRESLPMHRYNDTPGDMPLPSVQMLASRGCPYKCKFCLWPQVMYQSNQYRTRDVKDVVDEMEYLVKQLHFKSIYFDDDTFNCGKERLLCLCDEIKRRSLSVPWGIMARADLMDEEILMKMRNAGLYAVKYGVESSNQELVDNASKNMNLKKTEEVIRLTKMLGIKTHLTFTFGLPGETKESIYETIDLALTLDPTTIQFSIATPFPGTSFYKEMKEKGCIVSEDLTEYDGNNKSVIGYSEVTDKDLEQAIKLAYKQWAIHCARRAPRKQGYYQLLANSLRKYGLFMTIFKIMRFLIRNFVIFVKERTVLKKQFISKFRERGLKNGRLALFFENGALNLYWEGMKLTQGKGFESFFSHGKKNLPETECNFWDYRKLNDSELLLRRKFNNLALDEIWRIKVRDEKQIDWDVEVILKNKVETLVSTIKLILSKRYHTWIDSWGEGRFYPASETENVELRNPDTNFIGLRGRKKLKGQLPTCLLELSNQAEQCRPAIKNAESSLGGRVLEVEKKIFNGQGNSEEQRLFSVRIKIVEEDFKKRKTAYKR